ncbi:DNA-directed RNA polymerase III subunit RPC10 [Aethina tumida]|uniref:DNA-directed RNA polymerase III subunit RPC10 n=1 Tax=Aethina tumida TaxID=116153 RepID=UPI00096ADEC9|nr:DNA-directed RNA polymerase III subunit RPC10 [Aethina tumida]XP_019881681.1 DNA-directed RNA polymerase III subunit RPC10 [Aethina tumida]
MVHFCPYCNNLLFVEESGGKLQFTCNLCPVYFPIKSNIVYRNHYKLKEIDDVLGGAEAWKNVDSTEERCPKCSHPRAYFMQLQTRSADEPMTTFYRCCNPECNHNWRD